MRQVLNAQSILMAVGVLQPTNHNEVIGLLKTMLPKAGEMPSADEVLRLLKEHEKYGHILRVARFEDAPDLYSLTLNGHRYLSLAQRKVRDKLRFYLLKSAHDSRVKLLEGEAQRLVGDTPTSDDSSPIKGSATNKIGQRVPSGQSYWSRISRQFDVETGSSVSPSNTLSKWISFNTKQQCALAVGCAVDAFEFDYEGLAACLGVSPKVISQIANKPERHYREFPIAKRGGGVRTIHSPRTFLKVIQWFISENLTSRLPVHGAVHSFRSERSIVTNAQNHVRQAFVANIDIENFFGSLKQEQVRKFFQSAGLAHREAVLFSRLSCRDGVLPQGAPTSPIISNAILFWFDERMSSFAEKLNLNYTRYADDITFSGEDKVCVQEAINEARILLAQGYGLSLKNEKTRIASSNSQQRVTGVVVNTQATLPRDLRRKMRAMFHNASKEPSIDLEDYQELQGHLAFLKMFPELQGTSLYQKCLSQLSTLKVIGRYSREL